MATAVDELGAHITYHYHEEVPDCYESSPERPRRRQQLEVVQLQRGISLVGKAGGTEVT